MERDSASTEVVWNNNHLKSIDYSNLYDNNQVDYSYWKRNDSNSSVKSPKTMTTSTPTTTAIGRLPLGVHSRLPEWIPVQTYINHLIIRIVDPPNFRPPRQTAQLQQITPPRPTNGIA